MKKERSDTLNWKQTFLRGVLIDVYYSSECLLALSFYMLFKSFFCWYYQFRYFPPEILSVMNKTLTYRIYKYNTDILQRIHSL